MTRVYYREAVGALVVFDMTRLSTFQAVLKWKGDLDSKVGAKCLLSFNIIKGTLHLNLQPIFIVLITSVRGAEGAAAPPTGKGCYCKGQTISSISPSTACNFRSLWATGGRFQPFYWPTRVTSVVKASAPNCPNWRTSPESTGSWAGLKRLRR